MSNSSDNPQNKPIKDLNTNKQLKNVDMKKLYIYTGIGVVAISLIAYFFLGSKYSKPLTTKDSEISNNSSKKKKVVTTIEDEDFTQNIKIEQLQENVKDLEVRLDKIKLNSELPKLILSFYELRAAIDLGADYEVKLQEFSALSVKDYNLSQKVQELSRILRNKNYKEEDIEEDFKNNYVDRLIALKSQDDKDNKVGKMKSVLSKLIIVRRIDGKVTNKSEEVDLKILKIEKLIHQKSYKAAISQITTFDEKYQKELRNFTEILQTQADLDAISKDIFSYLKTVVNNV